MGCFGSQPIAGNLSRHQLVRSSDECALQARPMCVCRELRACSRSFRGSHWSAIGARGCVGCVGCVGCAAWVRARASSRGVKHSSSSARFHSNPSGKCLVGRSAVLQRLPIPELLAAHRALHPLPARALCDPEKILNRFWRLNCSTEDRVDADLRSRLGPSATSNVAAEPPFLHAAYTWSSERNPLISIGLPLGS